MKSTGDPIIDGDNENDVVPNTGLTFYRADMLALAEAILALKPPVSHTVTITTGVTVEGKNFGFAAGAAIQGLAADDFIVGAGNGEIIRGGAGADQIDAGDGDDQVYGEAGDDRLTGGPGNDTLDGGDGRDAAVFTGKRAEYTLTVDATARRVIVTDSVANRDGVDTLDAVEQLVFADLSMGAFTVNNSPSGSVTITGTAVQGQSLTASNNLSDADGIPSAGAGVLTYQWKANGTAINGATGSSYSLTQADVGKSITVTASYIDNAGTSEAVTSASTAAVTGLSGASPPQGIAYHWKSHILLSGVNVSVGSAAAVQANAGDLFDLRGARFEASTSTLSVDVWANASANFGNFDFRATTAGATAASFTSALPEGWTVTAGTANPQSVLVSAISLGNLNGSVKLGTLQIILPANSTMAEVAFSQIKVGNADGASQGLAMQACTTGVDGAYAFTSLGSQALQLVASRSTADAGNAVTSADALAALRIAVGLNPNPDPDGASGPKTAPAISPYQIMAADVNGSGTVTSADALAILRMAVKLSTALPQEWFFVEETRDFWDEAANGGQGAFTLNRGNTNWDRAIPVPTQGGTVNLVGVLKGDVNGSWAAPAGSTDLDNTNPTYFEELAKKIGVPNQDQWGGPPGP